MNETVTIPNSAVPLPQSRPTVAQNWWDMRLNEDNLNQPNAVEPEERSVSINHIPNEPAFDWTTEGYETREALKRYSN